MTALPTPGASTAHAATAAASTTRDEREDPDVLDRPLAAPERAC